MFAGMLLSAQGLSAKPCSNETATLLHDAEAGKDVLGSTGGHDTHSSLKHIPGKSTETLPCSRQETLAPLGVMIVHHAGCLGALAMGLLTWCAGQLIH
eukprot:4408302-Amphidinium_carterae.1